MDTPGNHEGLFGRPFDWRDFEDAEPTQELKNAYQAYAADAGLQPTTIEQYQLILQAEGLNYANIVGQELADINSHRVKMLFTEPRPAIQFEYTDDGEVCITTCSPSFQGYVQPPDHIRLMVQEDSRHQRQTEIAEQHVDPYFFDTESWDDSANLDATILIPEDTHQDPQDGNPYFVYGSESIVAQRAVALTLEQLQAECRMDNGMGSALFEAIVQQQDCFIVVTRYTHRLAATNGTLTMFGEYSEKVPLYTMTAYRDETTAREALAWDTEAVLDFKSKLQIDPNLDSFIPARKHRLQKIAQRLAQLLRNKGAAPLSDNNSSDEA